MKWRNEVGRMDNRTLAVMTIAVGAIVSLSLMTASIYRRNHALSLFTAGFVTSLFGTLLLFGQGHVDPWISIVLANVLIVSLFFFLWVGFRAFHEMAVVWPRRLWV